MAEATSADSTVKRRGSPLKTLLHRSLSWCPLYKALLGGYRYYRCLETQTYHPEEFLWCGKDVRIGRDVSIIAPSRMSIGDFCFIGEECRISAIGGLELGSYCAVASRTMILTTEHDFREAESLPWGEARIVRPVVIGDCAWIGMNASILSGVTIGEGAIVGMSAVVSRDVPSRAVVVGNPSRVVGYRDEEQYKRLKSSGALRPPIRRCSLIRVPPDIRQKFGSLLQNVGYGDADGRDEFPFDC